MTSIKSASVKLLSFLKVPDKGRHVINTYIQRLPKKDVIKRTYVGYIDVSTFNYMLFLTKEDM